MVSVTPFSSLGRTFRCQFDTKKRLDRQGKLQERAMGLEPTTATLATCPPTGKTVYFAGFSDMQECRQGQKSGYGVSWCQFFAVLVSD